MVTPDRCLQKNYLWCGHHLPCSILPHAISDRSLRRTTTDGRLLHGECLPLTVTVPTYQPFLICCAPLQAERQSMLLQECLSLEETCDCSDYRLAKVSERNETNGVYMMDACKTLYAHKQGCVRCSVSADFRQNQPFARNTLQLYTWVEKYVMYWVQGKAGSILHCCLPRSMMIFPAWHANPHHFLVLMKWGYSS